MRLTRLDQKLAAGIAGLFLLPGLLAAGVLVALYRWGAFHDVFTVLVTVVVGLAALMGYLGLIAHTIGQSMVRTLRQLQVGTELIATVNPAHRLEIETGDELQRLAEEINHLADRLATARQDGARAVAGTSAVLEAERTRLAGVLDALGDGVLVVSPGGRVSLANRAAQVLAGEPLLGRDMADVLADATSIRQAAERFRAGARGAERFALRPRRGGALEGIATPLLEGDGRLTGVTIVLRQPPGEQREDAGDPVPPRRGAGFASGLGPAGPAPAPPEFYDFSLLDDLGRRLTLDDRMRPLDRLACTVLDVETTGLDPSGGDGIVSVACVRIREGVVRGRETLDVLVDPGRPIPPESARIHGITDDMVAGAPSIEVALPEILRFAQGTVLVGHHVWFDLRFLRRATDRLGLPPLTKSHPVLDTRLLSRLVHHHLAGHDLEAVCARLGVVPLGRHSALGDAMATAEIMVRLVELLHRRGIRTLGDLLAAVEKFRERLSSSMP